jgi:uncharacterized protein
VIVVVFSSGAQVRAELVVTPEEIRRGFQHRTSIPDGTGMFFDMGGTAVHHFWMHDVLVPLDMIFFTPGYLVVGIVANAQPGDPTLRGYLSRYVLEVPGGWCARNGVRIGQWVQMVTAPS